MTSTTTPKPAASTKPKAATAKKPAASGKAAQPTLAQAAAEGDVKFFHRRQTGTLRYLPYLAPGTEARKQAEAVAKRREAGETVGAIAEDMKTSVATVRRMITGLLLAQQVEAGDHDKAWKRGDKQLVLSGDEGQGRLMHLHFTLRRGQGDEPYRWLLSVSDVTTTGTTGLSRRETRFLCSLVRTATREQRHWSRVDDTSPPGYVDWMKEQMVRKKD